MLTHFGSYLKFFTTFRLSWLAETCEDFQIRSKVSLFTSIWIILDPITLFLTPDDCILTIVAPLNRSSCPGTSAKWINNYYYAIYFSAHYYIICLGVNVSKRKSWTKQSKTAGQSCQNKSGKAHGEMHTNAPSSMFDHRQSAQLVLQYIV